LIVAIEHHSSDAKAGADKEFHGYFLLLLWIMAIGKFIGAELSFWFPALPVAWKSRSNREAHNLFQLPDYLKITQSAGLL